VDGSGALLICGSLPTSSNQGRLSSASARSSLLNSFQEHSRIHNTSSFHADAPMSVADDEGGYFDDGNDAGDDWGYGGGGDDHSTHCPVRSAPPPGSPVRTGGSSAGPHAPGVLLSKVPPKKAAAPAKDVFAQLDPHIVVSGSREARRAKTYKVPTALQRGVAPNPAAPRTEHLYADFKRSNADLLRDNGSVPAKGLFNSSLLPLLQAKRKQVRRAHMLYLRQQRLLRGEGDVVEGAVQYQNLHMAGAGNLNVSRHEELWSQDYDYDDGDNDVGGGFGDDGGANDGFQYPADAGGADMGAGADPPYSSRRASGGGGVFGGDGDADGYMEETEEEALARRVALVLNDELNQSNRTSYESICQKYIANFNQGADVFAR
jgi:hypothetical protein